MVSRETSGKEQSDTIQMTKFVELPLCPELQARLAAGQFINSTPIQSTAIPAALEGKDLVATAQTGTGKTLAFLIPMIELLGKNKARGITGLVLVPTRELAIQVHAQFEQLRGRTLSPAALVIGGLAEKKQLQAIRRGAQVIVATPGRLEDYLRRGLVDLKSTTLVVLDEADRMLDMGFLPAIRRIFSVLPRQRQTLCFSATLEQSVAGLVNQYMLDPVRIALGSTLKPVDSVELQAFEVPGMQKGEVLRQLLREHDGRTLVFARTKRGTERLAKQLARDGFTAGMIHGDRSQAQRTAALNNFEQGTVKVLVATDVAARGLHVEEIAHVINYDLPTLPEDFIHRIGRTGRAGASGLASTLVSGAEVFELKSIERALKLRIKRKDIAVRNASIQSALPLLRSRTLIAMPGEVFV